MKHSCYHLFLHVILLVEDTLVIFSTDHGDFMGDHGLYLKGPMHYEGLLRVGLLMKGPGVPLDKVVNSPVSTLDLCPTFLDYAGGESEPDLHGTSLRHLLEDPTADRDFALNEWDLLPGRAGVKLDLRVVRTQTHKLTLELESGEGEMYDLKNDPHELHNLFHEPAQRAVRNELTDMIRSRPDDMRPVGTPVGAA